MQHPRTASTPAAPRPASRRARLLAAGLLGLAVAACQEVRLPGVYRIDIQQGNVIAQEQLAALEPGMEKRKVRFILGTPLLRDAFHQDRWDYYYSFEDGGGDRVRRLISVHFENERLVRVGGDVLPARGPLVAEARKDELVSVPEGYRDEGILAALTPGLFSGRERFSPPERSDDAAEPTPAADPATEGATPADVDITGDDARYLREVLQGFGVAPAPGADAAAAQAPAATGDTPPGEADEEGVLSRWARRLGLDGPAPDPLSGSAQ